MKKCNITCNIAAVEIPGKLSDGKYFPPESFRQGRKFSVSTEPPPAAREGVPSKLTTQACPSFIRSISQTGVDRNVRKESGVEADKRQLIFR